MKAFNVTNASQELAPAGHRRFIHIQNVSDADIFLKYDGSATALTTANGFKLIPGAALLLDNENNLHSHAVHVIHGGAGNKEIRVQGID